MPKWVNLLGALGTVRRVGLTWVVVLFLVGGGGAQKLPFSSNFGLAFELGGTWAGPEPPLLWEEELMAEMMAS